MSKKPTALDAWTWKYNPAVFNHGKRKPMTPEMLVVHCSATPPDMDCGVDQIDYWHRQRGFTAVGYHFVIRRDGTIEAGRPLHEPGAHATGFNRTAFGVCLVGGVDKDGNPEDNFTSDQYRSLYQCAFNLIGMYHLTAMVGHRDLPEVSKDCPCFDVKAWVEKHPELVELISNNLRIEFGH